MSARSAVSYPARSEVRLSTMTIFAAASSSDIEQDGPVLAVDGQRLSNGVDITRARVAVVRGQSATGTARSAIEAGIRGVAVDTGLQPHAHH